MPDLPHLKRLDSARLSIGVVMPRSHELASAKYVRLSDIARFPVILPDSSLSIGTRLSRALVKAKIDLTAGLVTNSMALMHRLAIAECGIILKPRVGLDRELASGKLRFVPLREPGLEEERLTLFAGWESQLSPAANALALELTRLLRRLEGNEDLQNPLP